MLVRIKKWFHDKLGWGIRVRATEEMDGINILADCQFCDYAICRDSTGSWFHLSRKNN